MGYTMNFTPSEIAYCILQSTRMLSFAGLFQPKEAIVRLTKKSSRSFNTIGITHGPEGQLRIPVFIFLSRMPAGWPCRGRGVPSRAEQAPAGPVQQMPSAGTGRSSLWLSWLALLAFNPAIILGFTR